MSDWTETHRATLAHLAALTNARRVGFYTPEVLDAIDAALAEIDRLHEETGLLKRSLERLVKDTARDVTPA